MPSQTTAQENPATGVIPVAPWRLEAVSALPGYRLALTFRDGLTGVADLSAITTTSNPGIYAPLAVHDFFKRVQIELGVPIWPNGADLDPVWLHDNLLKDKTWSVPF